MGCGASNTSAIPVNTVPSSRPAVPAVMTRPLTKTKNYRHGSPISRIELTNQREEFWSTRVDGRPEAWQAIRVAAEAMLEDDIELAQAVCEAGNITTPNGTLELCYDERGNQYKVPVFCLANPIELGQSNDNDPTSAYSNGSEPTQVTPLDPANGSGHNGTIKLKSNKVTVEGTPVHSAPIEVRIRVNPGDHNLTVKAHATYSILELKQAIMDEASRVSLPVAEAVTEDRQRVIFMGRELNNGQKINEIGFEEAKVVQVFLRPKK